jgi:hypothetical protein
MHFKQTNNNTGDVNNAISDKGNVVQTVGDANNAISEKGTAVQTVGDENKVKVEQPKEDGFWVKAWEKLKGCWKWIFGSA